MPWRSVSAIRCLSDEATNLCLTEIKDSRGSIHTPAAVLLPESNPEVAGQVYQRLVEAFGRLSGMFESRLGYPEGSIEPKVVASSLVALWFVVIHGWPGSEAEGTAPPMAINEIALRAFGLYSDGLAKVWEQPKPRRDRRRPG